MAEATFRLADSFVNKYKKITPPFGFNGLGEFVYLRTYSRIKDDGTNEVWYETVRRVVEGTYRMQERHIRSQDLGWSDARAQKSAQEMYDRMFHMKFLPPGRGMWAMGSALTEERELYAALNNCFEYETEIITRNGVRSIGDICGQTVEVLTDGGKWVEAPIKSFGEQQLVKLTLTRQGIEKVIYTTANHRWFAKSQSEVSHSKGFSEYHTNELKEGYRLKYVFGHGAANVRKSPFGIAHGITFGDGTTASNPHLYLCGEKDAELAKWFPLSHITKDDSKNALRVADLPKYFKRKPSIKESTSYLSGWLSGYFAADGCCSANGQVSISSARYGDLQFVKDVAALLGIGTYDIRKNDRVSNLTDGDSVLYTMSFMSDTLTEDFFLLESHRNNFKPEMSKRFWNVKSVEETDRVEEVYCAVVPNTHSFALDGNILTGNCAFVSTEFIDKETTEPFTFLMDASMVGIGVGFDVKGASKLRIFKPTDYDAVTADDWVIREGLFWHGKYYIPDTREGWVESLRLLLNSYFEPMQAPVYFDYSYIRPQGLPIKGFGGTSSGPEPLRQMHEAIRKVLDSLVGNFITETAIVDIMNLIGCCVVAGNVRRTAEIVFGPYQSEEYLSLKDYHWVPEYTVHFDDQVLETIPGHYEGSNAQRAGHGWTSNNSVFCDLGMDYKPVAAMTHGNGEPGYMWLENAKAYGRMGDAPNGKDKRVRGANPCVEQSLEHFELCNLVETFPNNCTSLADYRRTLKFAYLYAKTVTLGKTHWPKTNKVLLRNRRIGTSMSGVQQFIAANGLHTLKEWCESGYDYIQYVDRKYSEWFAVPLSVKTTSIKPSGTVSLLAGATPGMHWPESRYYIRRIRLSAASPYVGRFREANYIVEDCVGDDSSVVIEFYVALDDSIRTVSEVSIWEQFAMAAFLQRYWADNQVSSTVTFDPERVSSDEIAAVLDHYQYQLKGISLLPKVAAGAYAQMPYEEITGYDYYRFISNLLPLNLTGLSEEATPERGCSNDTCVVDFTGATSEAH